MAIGVSSACFYPMETENALTEIGKLGIHTAEIFFNADEELGEKYLKKLNEIKSFYAIETPSMHPFTSVCESFFFFSRYEKRFYEMTEYYKKYFHAANVIGAKALIIHGAKVPCEVEDEVYFERFSHLYDVGQTFGVDVLQENVFTSCGGNPEFLKKMKRHMGEKFKFNFDVKQMKKCGFDTPDFLDEFAPNIANIHVSDNNKAETCLPPGMGTYDFKGLFDTMKKFGYCGNYIIELYSQNFSSSEDIKKSYEYLVKYC